MHKCQCLTIIKSLSAHQSVKLAHLFEWWRWRYMLLQSQHTNQLSVRTSSANPQLTLVLLDVVEVRHTWSKTAYNVLLHLGEEITSASICETGQNYCHVLTSSGTLSIYRRTIDWESGCMTVAANYGVYKHLVYPHPHCKKSFRPK